MVFSFLELPLGSQFNFRHGSELKRWLSTLNLPLPEQLWNRVNGQTLQSTAVFRFVVSPLRPKPQIVAIGVAACEKLQEVAQILNEGPFVSCPAHPQFGLCGIREIESGGASWQFLPYQIDTLVIDRPSRHKTKLCNFQWASKEAPYPEATTLAIAQQAIRKGLAAQCDLLGERDYAPDNLRFGRSRIVRYRPVPVGRQAAMAMSVSLVVEMNYDLRGSWQVGRNVNNGCGAIYPIKSFAPKGAR